MTFITVMSNVTGTLRKLTPKIVMPKMISSTTKDLFEIYYLKYSYI
jgi:hypothetical protein